MRPKYIRWTAIALLVLGFIGMAARIRHQAKRIDTLATERAQALLYAKTQKANATTYQNKYNRETVKTSVLDLSLYNAKELIDTERMGFISQFNGINKRLNNLVQATNTTALFVRSWKLPLRDTVLHSSPFGGRGVDSTIVKAQAFAYMDSLNTIRGIIYGNEIFPIVEIKVPIQRVDYWERKKILGLRIGRKQWYSDVTSTNPFVKIIADDVIRIKKN